MSYQIVFTDELYHHGIKGQKWGIRRFQNPDGTRKKSSKNEYSRKSNIKKKVIIGASVAAGILAVYGLTKYTKVKASKDVIAKGNAVADALLGESMNYRAMAGSPSQNFNRYAVMTNIANQKLHESYGVRGAAQATSDEFKKSFIKSLNYLKETKR